MATPTLPLLLDFPGCGDIVQKIAPHYKKFGIMILNDKDGSIVDCTEMNHPKDAYSTALAILRKWMNRIGEPVTWQALVANLKKIGCAEMAKTIQDGLAELWQS